MTPEDIKSIWDFVFYALIMYSVASAIEGDLFEIKEQNNDSNN